MITRYDGIYQKLLPGFLGDVQELLEKFYHVPTWYVFEGNLNNPKDLEEYTDMIAKIISEAKEFVRVCDIGEEPFIVTDNAVLIERRYPV